MDEEEKNEFIDYLNDLDKKADTLDASVHLYAIEEAILNNVDVPLDNIYNCVRKDYNAIMNVLVKMLMIKQYYINILKKKNAIIYLIF